MSGFSSMLSFATVTLSPSSFEISSNAGAIIRQGPHHSAQKSTRTGPSAPKTSLAKLWSVTVLVAMAATLLRVVTVIWGLGRSLSSAKLEEARSGSVEQGRADFTARKDHS